MICQRDFVACMLCILHCWELQNNRAKSALSLIILMLTRPSLSFSDCLVAQLGQICTVYTQLGTWSVMPSTCASPEMSDELTKSSKGFFLTLEHHGSGRSSSTLRQRSHTPTWSLATPASWRASFTAATPAAFAWTNSNCSLHRDASGCIKYHRSASRMSVFLVFGMCSRLETKNITWTPPHPEPVRPLQHRHELPIRRHFDQNLQSFNEISCHFIDNAAGASVAGAKPATLAASVIMNAACATDNVQRSWNMWKPACKWTARMISSIVLSSRYNLALWGQRFSSVGSCWKPSCEHDAWNSCARSLLTIMDGCLW